MKQKRIVFIYSLLIAGLYTSLPLQAVSRALPNVFLVMIIILFPFVIKKEHFKRLLKLPLILYFSLTIYIFMKILFSGNLFDEFSHTEKYVLSILLLILSLPSINNINFLKKGLVIGVFIAILISIGSIIYHQIVGINFSLTSGGEVNHILMTERVYISFLGVISFSISLDYILAKHVFRKIYLFNILFVLAFIVLIAARIALLSTIVIFLYRIYRSTSIKYTVITLGIIVFAVTFIIIFSKNLSNRFLFKDKDNSLVENIKIWEPRVAIWNCVYLSTSNEKFSWVTGFDSYMPAQQSLYDCYEHTIENIGKRNYFLEKKFNSHNQFFDLLLSTGLIGLTVFISFFLSTLIKTKDPLIVSLVLSFILLGLVENFMYRQVGAYSLGLMMIFFSLSSKNNIKGKQ